MLCFGVSTFVLTSLNRLECNHQDSSSDFLKLLTIRPVPQCQPVPADNPGQKWIVSL